MADITLNPVKLGVTQKTNVDVINDNFANLDSGKLDVDGTAVNAQKVNNHTVEQDILSTNKILTQEEYEALGAAEDMVYTNSTPIVQAIGGIKVGDTFDNMSMEEMFNKLLYPYVKPLAAISVTPNGGVYEKGTSVNVTSVKVTGTVKSEKLKTIEAKNGSASIGTKNEEEVKNGGQFEFVTDPIAVTTNTSFSGIVSDSQNSVTATGGSFTFVDPFFWGVVAPETPVTSEMVTGLTKVVQTKGSKTFTYTTNNQCMVIAYPASYGDLKSALDPNKFENISSYTKTTLDVTVTSGSVSYNVYVKEASTASDFAITYSF